jgi:ribosomal protein S27AE
MRHDGARAPLTAQLGERRLVRAMGSAAGRSIVTARLDHRRCEKCGYEFTVPLSLTAVRRSLLVMERGRARWPCPKCGSQETVVVSTGAFPSNRLRQRVVGR